MSDCGEQEIKAKCTTTLELEPEVFEPAMRIIYSQNARSMSSPLFQKDYDSPHQFEAHVLGLYTGAILYKTDKDLHDLKVAHSIVLEHIKPIEKPTIYILLTHTPVSRALVFECSCVKQSRYLISYSFIHQVELATIVGVFDIPCYGTIKQDYSTRTSIPMCTSVMVLRNKTDMHEETMFQVLDSPTTKTSPEMAVSEEQIPTVETKESTLDVPVEDLPAPPEQQTSSDSLTVQDKEVVESTLEMKKPSPIIFNNQKKKGNKKRGKH